MKPTQNSGFEKESKSNTEPVAVEVMDLSEEDHNFFVSVSPKNNMMIYESVN